MIVTDKDGQKMYGVVSVEEGKNGKSYLRDLSAAAGEFIEENLDILQEIIAKFKLEQDE